MRLFLSCLIVLCLMAGAAHAGKIKPAVAVPKETKAIFAGGHFWSLQPPFDGVPGVIKTQAGYTGGRTTKPTFAEVATGKTGHVLAVEVTYDPAVVSYERLLYIYWRNIDPTDGAGQFCDRGLQYSTFIFYYDDAMRQKADDSKMLLEADNERFDGKPIVTRIYPASKFYPAEDYHQGYYTKNPFRFNFYKGRCGRDLRLNALWGKNSPKK